MGAHKRDDKSDDKRDDESDNRSDDERDERRDDALRAIAALDPRILTERRLLDVSVRVHACLNELTQRSAEGGVDPPGRADIVVRLRVIATAALRLDQLREELARAPAVVDRRARAAELHELQGVRAALDGLAIAALADTALRRLVERAPHLRAAPPPAPTCACGRPTMLREGRYGPFWGCTDFPRCRGLRRLTRAEVRALVE